MTFLKRLELSGIRLFRENKPQTIEFEPVTLITGENGVGKSTIIDALRFATIEPHQSDLITLPSTCQTNKTTSNISLSFTSNDHQNIEINRTTNLNQTKINKETAKTESFFLKIPGKIVNVNADEISKKIQEYLKISPAILKYVSFCDQKNSLWPLEDSPKELKIKFDQIFDMTKYKESFEELNRLINEYEGNKELEIVQKESRINNYKTYLQIKEKIDALKNKIITYDAQIEIKNNQIKNVEKVINNYNKNKEEIDKFDNEIKKKEAELLVRKNDAELFRKKIQNLEPKENYKKSLESVQNEISELLSNINSDKQNYNESLKNQEKLNNEKAEINEKINEITKESNFYLLKIEEFKNKYKSDDLDMILSMKENSFKKAQNEFKTFQDQTKSDIDKRSEEITKLKENIAKENADVSHIKEEIKNNKSELLVLENIDENKIENAKSMKENANQEINDFINSEKTPEAIENEIKEYEKELKIVENELKSINQMKNYSLKLNEYESQIEKSKIQIDYHLNIIKEKLNDQSIEAEKAKQLVEDTVNNLKKEIKELKSEQSNVNINLNCIKTQLKQEQKIFEDSEKETKQVELKIFNIYSSIDEYYIEYKSNEKELNIENQNLIIIKNNESIYKKYQEEATKSHSCPLCKRKFISDDEYKNFVENDLIKIISEIPKEIENCESKINKYKNKLNELNKISDFIKIYQKNCSVRDQRINSVKLLQEKEKELTNKLNDISSEIHLKEETLNKIENIKENAIILDQEVQKVKTITKDCDQIKEENDNSLQTFEEVQEKEKILNEKSKQIHNAKDQLYKNKENYIKTKNQLEKQKYQAESQLNDLNDKYEKKLKIDNSIKLLSKSLEEKNEKLKKSSEEINKLTQELSEKSNLYSQKNKELENKRDDLSIDFQTCFSLVKNIKQAKEKLDSEDLNKTLKQLNDLQTQYNLKSDELEKTNQIVSTFQKNIETSEEKMKRLSELKEDLINQDSYYTKIEECNLIIQELEELKKERSNQLGEFADIDINELTNKYHEMDNDMTKLTTIKDCTEKQKTSEEENLENYKDAPKKLFEINFQINLIERSIIDITRYAKELDNAIINYHNKKMEDVNSNIHTLWQNIYHGRDIDSIEIICDGEKKGNAQYGYRVLMNRNGKKLNMNTYCSAGQKVLASIVIRLALALTFAKECPIIALDEPTTNLDKSNIENLADQLGNLYKNIDDNDSIYQIIIITHNRYFMELLNDHEMLTSYYQITRNKDKHGDYSIITKSNELNLQ